MIQLYGKEELKFEMEKKYPKLREFFQENTETIIK